LQLFLLVGIKIEISVSNNDMTMRRGKEITLNFVILQPTKQVSLAGNHSTKIILKNVHSKKYHELNAFIAIYC
jgi:hypothetical protein